MAQETFKVAVYGSLRKGLSNHARHLGYAKYLGRFDTDPLYTMYSVNLAFPALLSGGTTSVVMEVYEVSEDELSSINRLEGYNGENSNNYYERREINTPYGKAYWYEYNRSVASLYEVESGDWYSYKKNHKILENAKR